ncbi:Transient receptor putative cation channel sub A member 1 [Phlyctochytrium bullatum]|nr:Transient receptor putative cation channel sub A member 1 [Phlyctochytrium bullatum]
MVRIMALCKEILLFDDEEREAFEVSLQHVPGLQLLEFIAIMDLNKVNENGDERLSVAARYGLCDLVKLLLEKGADAKGLVAHERNCVGSNGNTPLHWAAFGGCVQCINLLLEAGANIFTQSEEGAIPLHLACQGGHVATIKALVDHEFRHVKKPGKDLISHHKTNLGLTPLHYAARYSHVDAIQFLVEVAGASVQAHTVCMWTPLHVAARYGKPEAVETLLELGAKANQEDLYGKTPSFLALERSHFEVADTLRKAMKREEKLQESVLGSGGPLHYAAEHGDTEALRKLLTPSGSKSGPGVDNQDHRGCTALHTAARHGQVDALIFLLSCSATVDARSDDGRTPLHEAAYAGNTDAVQALLNAGASIEAETCTGTVPLHFAACAGRLGVVKMLLEQGASPVKVDSAGFTPLMIAEGSDHTDIVAVLVAAEGAHPGPVGPMKKKETGIFGLW